MAGANFNLYNGDCLYFGVKLSDYIVSWISINTLGQHSPFFCKLIVFHFFYLNVVFLQYDLTPSVISDSKLLVSVKGVIYVGLGS